MSAVASTTTWTLSGREAVIKWTSVTEADTFTAVSIPGYRPVAYQVAGTFGSATVVLNGSIDGTNFGALADTAAAAISKTSAAVGGVRDAPLWIKPTHSGGSSETVTVSVRIVRLLGVGSI